MFGMPLSQVIACATVNAARIFPAFDDRGTLNVGAPADVAVLELRQGMFEFLDNYNSKRNGKRRELDDLREKFENVSGFRKEIDHALERVAEIGEAPRDR
jgi:predicted amidohydrolase